MLPSHVADTRSGPALPDVEIACDWGALVGALPCASDETVPLSTYTREIGGREGAIEENGDDRVTIPVTRWSTSRLPVDNGVVRLDEMEIRPVAAGQVDRLIEGEVDDRPWNAPVRRRTSPEVAH
jgi:hypothetical protein